MNGKAPLFLAVFVLGCGEAPLPKGPPEPGAEKKRTGTRGPAAKKAKKAAAKRRIRRYLPPAPKAKELDLLKHLRYAEFTQEHDAPSKPGWTEPGETYPLDSVESVMQNMRPIYDEMAAIVERTGAIEPVDYLDLRRLAGRLSMHADEIYRLKAGKDPGKAFVTEEFAEAAPSNEWCLKVMAARIEMATFLEATQELRKLWEDFGQVTRACDLGLAGGEEERGRRR